MRNMNQLTKHSKLIPFRMVRFTLPCCTSQFNATLSGSRKMDIINIHRFEKLRDGGSLVVSFQSSDSCEYWLMFPKVSGEIENPIFGNPTLVNRTTGIEVELSLDVSKQYLFTLEPYFEKRPELPYVSKEVEAEIYSKMVALCEQST